MFMLLDVHIKIHYNRSYLPFQTSRFHWAVEIWKTSFLRHTPKLLSQCLSRDHSFRHGNIDQFLNVSVVLNFTNFLRRIFELGPFWDQTSLTSCRISKINELCKYASTSMCKFS